MLPFACAGARLPCQAVTLQQQRKRRSEARKFWLLVFGFPASIFGVWCGGRSSVVELLVVVQAVVGSIPIGRPILFTRTFLLWRACCALAPSVAPFLSIAIPSSYVEF